MAAFTTEVFIFDTSKEFSDNPELALPALELALKAGGIHQTAFYGTQIENPSTGYVFLNWHSYESHKAFIDSPSYASVGGALLPSLRIDGKREVYHVVFPDPTMALDKPVTQVFILSLKAPENRVAVVEELSKLSKASGDVLVFGQTREDENKYIVVGGWPSVEAHWDMGSRPEVKAIVDTLYTLINRDHLYHTKLSQVTVE